MELRMVKTSRIAISELAETISSNLHLVEKHKNKVITGPLATYLKDKFSPLSSALSRFDNKDRRTANDPTEQDLRAIMKLVQDDKLFEETIADVFEASGSLFVMSVQLMALQTLLWNPELYAEKLKEGRATTNFKAEPCQREMREYLFGQIITNKTHDDRDHYRGQGAALWDKERERPSTSMRRGTGRSRKRSRSPSPRVAATRSRSPRRRDRDTASWEERSDRGSPQRDSPSPPRRSTGTKPYVRKASSKPHCAHFMFL